MVCHRYSIATTESVERDSAEGSFRDSALPWGLRLGCVGRDYHVVGGGMGSTHVKGVCPRVRVVCAGDDQVSGTAVISAYCVELFVQGLGWADSALDSLLLDFVSVIQRLVDLGFVEILHGVSLYVWHRPS